MPSRILSEPSKKEREKNKGFSDAKLRLALQMLAQIAKMRLGLTNLNSPPTFDVFSDATEAP